MEQFFKSLSKRELGTWIKQFTSYELLNQFLDDTILKIKNGSLVDITNDKGKIVNILKNGKVALNE